MTKQNIVRGRTTFNGWDRQLDALVKLPELLQKGRDSYQLFINTLATSVFSSPVSVELVINKQKSTSKNFFRSKYFLDCPVIASKRVIGSLKIFYTKSRLLNYKNSRDKKLLLLLAQMIAKHATSLNDQKVLKETNDRFESIIKGIGSHYFFYRHNTKGVFEYISPTIKQVLGYSSEKFLDHYSTYLTDHPINKIVEKHTQASMKGIKQDPYLVQIFDSKRRKKWLEVTEIPVKKKGKVIAVEGIAQDVTQKKRAQDELRLYKIGFENTPDSMMLASYKNNHPEIVDINSGFTRMYGWTKNEIKGKSPALISSKSRDPSFYKTMWSSILNPNKGYWQGKLTNKAKDGSMKEVILTITTVFERDVPTHFLASHVDLSKQIAAEREAAVSIEVRNKIINSAPFGIYVVNQTGSIEYVNPVMEEISGYSREFFIGINVFSLPTYKHLGLSDAIKKGLEGESFRFDDVEYTSYYANKFTIRNFIGIPITEQGESKLIMIVEDVTEESLAREQVENALEDVRTRESQLEQFNRLAVGRELKMIELKHTIERLQRQLSGTVSRQPKNNSSSSNNYRRNRRKRRVSS